MPSFNVTLTQAIEVLEITNLDSITADELPALKRRAMRRWHPDRVMHTNAQEQIDRYTQNFQAIDEALSVIQAYIKGKTVEEGAAVSGRSADFQAGEASDTVEILRKEAPRMQETLRNLWEKIKQTDYQHTQEESVIFEGWKIRNLLMQDLREDVPVMALSSLCNGFLLLVVLVFACLLLKVEPLANLFAIIWIIQASACMIGMLPLSRFWLPEAVQGVIFGFVNSGLAILNAAHKIQLTRFKPVAFAFGLPIRIAQIIKWVVLYPLYGVVGLFLGNATMGRVVRKVDYYASLADWYIEELMVKNPMKMTEEELFHLSHAYTEMKGI